ncbi:hypothetical protein, partial [Brachybacterium paraconglomeratum]|uniref:hypothetical protein n=1 Tax=Brachybacterium paraconglomeratum TaxID=173362 RepID=UPI0022AFA575
MASVAGALGDFGAHLSSHGLVIVALVFKVGGGGRTALRAVVLGDGLLACALGALLVLVSESRTVRPVLVALLRAVLLGGGLCHERGRLGAVALFGLSLALGLGAFDRGQLLLGEELRVCLSQRTVDVGVLARYLVSTPMDGVWSLGRVWLCCPAI